MAKRTLRNIFKAYSLEQFLDTTRKLKEQAERIEGKASDRIVFSFHSHSLAPRGCHPAAVESAIDLDNSSRQLVTNKPEDITQAVWDNAAYVSFSVFFNNERHRPDMSWGSISHDKNTGKRKAVLETRFTDDLMKLSL